MMPFGMFLLSLFFSMVPVDSASFLPPGVFLQRTVDACPCAFCSAGIKTALLGAAVDQADFAVNILPPTEDPIEIQRVFCSKQIPSGGRPLMLRWAQEIDAVLQAG